MSKNPGDVFAKNLYPDISDELRKCSLRLPESLAENYEVLSCLKYSEQTATYLLRQKSVNRTVLLKTASDPIFATALDNERNILDMIHRQGTSDCAAFPISLELYELKGTHYFIRSYIQGRTLEELCEANYKKPGLPEGQALLYILQLTKQLHFLHTLDPPVIHRDIKPQNVVVDTNDICHFIDLGISRFSKSREEKNSPIMGTQFTAPPEQFFNQPADVRGDLYSLGVLLHYCITGEYSISEASLKELSPALRKVVSTSTKFHPNQRYQTADELLKNLTAVHHTNKISVAKQ